MSRPWRRWALLGVAVASPAAAALAGKVVTVSQVGRAFAVAKISIARGDTIRFTNDDQFDHEIYVDSPSFKFESAEQAPGANADVLFTTSGTFDVQCQIHPRMHLAVTVE